MIKENFKFDEQQLEDIKDWVANYINDNCIYRVGPKENKLMGKAKDTKYTWQFYPRRGLLNARFLNSIGILFWNKFADKFKEKPFQIAGLETGSTPLVIGLAMTAGMFNIQVNALSIRAERKKYGLFNRFEGIINYDLPVLIVDDVCNSKNTIMRAKKHCEAEGLQIYDTGFTIINKDVDGDHQNHDKYIGPEFKIESIFMFNDFLLSWKEYEMFCSGFRREKTPIKWEKYRD